MTRTTRPRAFGPTPPASPRRPSLARAIAVGGLVLGSLALTAAPRRCLAQSPARRLGFEVTPVTATAAPGQPPPTTLPPPRDPFPAEQAPPPAKQPANGEALAQDLAKAPPVIPPPTQTYPIDLCTALKLAETDNPAIGISRQAIQAALASQLRANTLLLPTLRAGTNWHQHQGVLQTSTGLMRHVESESLYFGGGARTLAAETIGFPMIQVLSPIADAIFEPLVARRFVAVRQLESIATTNRVELDVAGRFLELVTAEAALVSLVLSEEDMNKIVEETTAFAKAGRGRPADASRARGEALLLHTERERAEERVAVASARLAELLNLDTSVRLQTPAHATGMLNLVDLHKDLEALVNLGQAARPELGALNAETARRQAMMREEQIRPFVPTLSVGYSTGSFGGGTNRQDLVPVPFNFGKFGSRADFDVLAYWTAQNLGFGNKARAGERRAQREVAAMERIKMLNQVRREVVAAYGRAQAGLRRVAISRQQLEFAEAGFREDLRRVRGGEGLPIEVLNSMNRLTRARLAVIDTLLEYNLGQFQLFVAIGQTPTAACAPPCDAP